MLNAMFKSKKPTEEEILKARNAVGDEIVKLERGDGSTTAERVKVLADAYLKLMKQAGRDPAKG